jgi:ATP-dependent Clp protease ATP-binding subunit ClpA
MFERFTDWARRVVVLAQEEARQLDHNYIGTEHLLLGLLREGHGTAFEALKSLGVSLEAARQQVEEIIGRGKRTPSGHIPFTPRAKKTLELALREALQLGHDYIGTEHILLGLIREGDGVAAQMLARLGIDLNVVRRRVIELLPSGDPRLRQSPSRPSERAPGSPLGIHDSLQEIMAVLINVSARLAAIEAHLGVRGPAASGSAPAELRTPGEADVAGMDDVAGVDDVAAPDDVAGPDQAESGAPDDEAPSGG